MSHVTCLINSSLCGLQFRRNSEPSPGVMPQLRCDSCAQAWRWRAGQGDSGQVTCSPSTTSQRQPSHQGVGGSRRASTSFPPLNLGTGQQRGASCGWPSGEAHRGRSQSARAAHQTLCMWPYTPLSPSGEEGCAYLPMPRPLLSASLVFPGQPLHCPGWMLAPGGQRGCPGMWLAWPVITRSSASAAGDGLVSTAHPDHALAATRWQVGRPTLCPGRVPPPRTHSKRMRTHTQP